MYRPWIIQISGILLILLLFFFSLPFAIQYISEIITTQVQANLTKEGLTWATAQAKGRDISLSGYTINPEEHQYALTISRSHPFVRKVHDDITPPELIEPYTMKIHWDGEELIVEGYVGSDNDKIEIEQYITTAFAEKKSQQKLTAALSAPKDWTKLTIQLLTQIKTLPLASIQMIDDTVYIAGKAVTSKEVNALQEAIHPFDRQTNPQGYTFKTRIVALDKSAVICQDTFSQLLKNDSIYFETGTTSIDARSNPLLEKLADTAIFCANSTIIITGHTDNVGDEAENMTLSQQRAKVVKGRVFTQGVPLERLKAVGRGSSNPVASNETKDGKAKNRRIEFTVEGL
jgi:OOP family OmpA-OmpF porin